MGLDALTENQLGHRPKCQKMHTHSLSTRCLVSLNWAYIRYMGNGLRVTSWFSKLPYLGMKVVHWPKLRKLHIYSLSTPGVEIEFIFTLRAVVSDIMDVFQNYHIWAWNLAIGRSSRSCTYALSTPRGQNWAYLRSTGSSFHETGQLSKLPYLGIKLDHSPKFQKLHRYSLSTPWGRDCGYFHSTRYGPIFKIAIFGHETWQLAKVPEVAHTGSYPLSNPGGWNWHYFHSMGSGFRDMWPIPVIKIVTFGHETWPLAKVPEVAHIPSSYPKGMKLSLFSLYWQRFPRYGPIFKLPYLGMKLGQWPKYQKLHIYPLSTPRGLKFSLFSPHRQRFPRYRPIAIFGHETWQVAKVPEVAHILSFYPRVEFDLIFTLRAAVSEIWANFQNCHIWAWNLAIGQSSRSCTYTFFLTQGVEIELIFTVWAAICEIRTDFQNCLIWAWNFSIFDPLG